MRFVQQFECVKCSVERVFGMGCIKETWFISYGDDDGWQEKWLGQVQLITKGLTV